MTARPPASSAVAAAQLEVLAVHADATAFYFAQLQARQLGRRPGPARCSSSGRAGGGGRRLPAATPHPAGPPSRTTFAAAAIPIRSCSTPGWVGMTTRRGGVVDRFRDRLMFPVHDPVRERVIDFLGRAPTEREDTRST